jgi:hypothetical protein
MLNEGHRVVNAARPCGDGLIGGERVAILGQAVAATSSLVDKELGGFGHSGPTGASLAPDNANRAAATPAASSTGVGCRKTLRSVMSQSRGPS